MYAIWANASIFNFTFQNINMNTMGTVESACLWKVKLGSFTFALFITVFLLFYNGWHMASFKPIRI